MYYYHVNVVIKNHPEVMKGVREFETCNDKEFYEIVQSRVLKQYKEEEILKIDVWLLASWNTELIDYLAKNKKAGG